MTGNIDRITAADKKISDRRRHAVTAILIMLALLLTAIAASVRLFPAPCPDSIEYDGKTFILLEYPADIFCYDLNFCVECEEDQIVPLDGSRWEMLYQSGDVFCLDTDYRDAFTYYNDHDNYDWFVSIEADDASHTYPITISAQDFDTIYEMEAAEKHTAIFFDEIVTMGSLTKVSRDGFIRGNTCLAEYGGHWYRRTEIIDENREKDGTWPEYIIPLPDAVSAEIELLCNHTQ